MESKLPKPSGLKKPTTTIKPILPTERIKENTNIFKSSATNRFPLARDVSNFAPVTNGVRASSPEVAGRPRIRAKLRRSRSACDIRDIRPLKRPDITLAPIPSKVAKFPAGNGATTATCNESNKKAINTTRGGKVNDVKPNVSNTTASKVKTKKIPAYDYKARFNDLVEKHKILKAKFEEAKEQLTNFDSLPEQYEECQNELIAAKDEIKNAKSEIECLQRQTSSQILKISSLAKCLHETKEQLEKITVHYEQLKKDDIIKTKELFELRELKEEYTSKLDNLTAELNSHKEQLFRSNVERKELHNAVMDLRGNIRVFCRVRPALNFEQEKLLCGWNFIDETTIEIQNVELLASGAKNKVASHTFSFDHVFTPKSRQEDIFEMVSPLIQSALDGFNVCIFAYGQTGSGKTFTMDGNPDNIGVIPRTVDLLFESIQNYKRLGWEYEIKATFLEIYNEILYDLLSNEQKDMEIRMAKNKTDIYVSNITEETVPTANRLRQLMEIAKMNRATAATAGNERSSRSHAVTRLELTGTHNEKGEISIGTINLVDLAGSESPKTSTRMNETKNINRSLSELTNVILALFQKHDHIPYRNSKLTHLLMPCLGGNSKTLMFINVAPFQDCFVESVKSLRFASSVNSCKVAKAKKNKFLNTSSSSLLSF